MLSDVIVIGFVFCTPRAGPPHHAHQRVAILNGVEVKSSVAVLADILLRSPRKLFLFIIKKIFTGSKYPEKKLIKF